MKKINILAFFFAFVLILASCEDTNENLVGYRGAAVVPEISDINPAFYTSDLANSFVAFKVALPEGENVDAAELQVTYKGQTTVLQQISSFPAEINIPATDVLQALSISENDVEIGDSFLVHVVTKSGELSSRSLAAMKILVTCEFNSELTTGAYSAVSSDWESAGDVTITADPEDPFKLYVDGFAEVDGLVSNGNKLQISIDPYSFKMTGVATVIADDVAPWDLPYTGFSYEPIGGLYNSCDGSFDLQIKITVDQGTFGTYNFTLTRK
ncbi:hypothetical protein ACRTDU_10820 [Sunxiuqinia elliptica]